MAEQQLPQFDRVFSIACWNSKGDGRAENRTKVYEYHLKECAKQGSLPDLVFLQELTISGKGSKVRDIQMNAMRQVLYDGIFEDDNTRGQYNCVLYNRKKFSKKETPKLEEAYQCVDQQLNPDMAHDLRLKSSQTKKLLERHIAIVTLTGKGHTITEIIAVSFHNIYKASGSNGPKAKLDMLMKLLHQLNRLTGIPVLLAGDFNMEVGDKLTWYPLTEHRKGQDLIDSIYLIDPMKKFKLSNVEAHMISGHSLCGYIWKDSTCRELTKKRLKKRGKSWNKTELKTMARRDNVSNHDPLIATLELLPSTHIGCYSVFSWNAARLHKADHKILLDHVLSKEYDLVFLQEGPNQPHLPYNDRYGSVGTTQPESNHECRPWVLFNKQEFKLNECKDGFLCKAWNGLRMKVKFFIEFSREKNAEKTMKSLEEKYPIEKKQAKVLLKKIEDGEFQCKLRTLYNGWTSIKKKDLEPHFALAMVHKISQPNTKSIIAVSFHMGDKNPIPILNLLLYLLEELHDLTGYPILLAGDFKMNLPEATQNLLLPYIQTEQREQKGPACVDYIMLRDDSKGSWTMDNVTPWEVKIHVEPRRAEDDSQEQIQPALQGSIEQMYPKLNKKFIGKIYPELERKITEHIDLEVTNAMRGIIGHNPLVTCLRQWST